METKHGAKHLFTYAEDFFASSPTANFASAAKKDTEAEKASSVCLTPLVYLKDETEKITSIGGGATGTLLAVNLIKGAAETNQQVEINLVERAEMRGRVGAYSATEDFHLLNVPAAKMGAFPDDIEHFHRWLDEKN